MDLPSRENQWYRDPRGRAYLMLAATDTKHAPWRILRSDNKKSQPGSTASRTLLSWIPYEHLKAPKIKLAKRSKKHAYDDQAAIKKPEIRSRKILARRHDSS